MKLLSLKPNNVHIIKKLSKKAKNVEFEEYDID